MNITTVSAHQILDSKGDPTIEAMVTLDDGSTWKAASPSGTSTGATEAIEVPVSEAIDHINTIIAPSLVSQSVDNQQALDTILITRDGTNNKAVLGGNTTTAISMALVKAGAHSHNLPLYSYIQTLTNTNQPTLPTPMFLVMEGGKHGNWATDIQEFMIIPNATTYKTFKERLDVCTRVFLTLEQLLLDHHYTPTIGLEGAFCPKELTSNEEALSLVEEAITKAGCMKGTDMGIGIDAASSSFYANGMYTIQKGTKQISSRQWIDMVIAWTKTYPILSLEDIPSESDWDEWVYLTNAIGHNHLVVGDDLLTTNIQYIQTAINKKAVNSVLIKVNQIGTISETLDAITLSHTAGFTTIVSHRSGETLDDTIADIAVGSASYCKFGGPKKPERMAKYNRLLAIEEELQHQSL